jgi:hypothetical protein
MHQAAGCEPGSESAGTSALSGVADFTRLGRLDHIGSDAIDGSKVCSSYILFRHLERKLRFDPAYQFDDRTRIQQPGVGKHVIVTDADIRMAATSCKMLDLPPDAIQIRQCRAPYEQSFIQRIGNEGEKLGSSFAIQHSMIVRYAKVRI